MLYVYILLFYLPLSCLTYSSIDHCVQHVFHCAIVDLLSHGQRTRYCYPGDPPPPPPSSPSFPPSSISRNFTPPKNRLVTPLSLLPPLSLSPSYPSIPLTLHLVNSQLTSIHLSSPSTQVLYDTISNPSLPLLGKQASTSFYISHVKGIYGVNALLYLDVYPPVMNNQNNGTMATAVVVASANKSTTTTTTTSTTTTANASIVSLDTSISTTTTTTTSATSLTPTAIITPIGYTPSPLINREDLLTTIRPYMQKTFERTQYDQTGTILLYHTKVSLSVDSRPISQSVSSHLFPSFLPSSLPIPLPGDYQLPIVLPTFLPLHHFHLCVFGYGVGGWVLCDHRWCSEIGAGTDRAYDEHGGWRCPLSTNHSTAHQITTQHIIVCNITPCHIRYFSFITPSSHRLSVWWIWWMKVIHHNTSHYITCL